MNLLGIDDCPFPRDVAGARFRGDVRFVGTVFAGTRLDGVLVGKVRRDGRNSTARIAQLLNDSHYRGHVGGILLQGIALAGFNVVDVHGLHQLTGLPVMVVARRQPRMAQIRAALRKLPGGERKWELIDAAGPMEPLRGVFVQRVGLGRSLAAQWLQRSTLHGSLPEPLRVAHLIAGALETGESRGRA
ncbi:MAG: DUF99 family protein [Polyangiaceae bacterium]|nr:DUF99 family protein [Myxococcales bacterium]MCB9590581.1 DUF99 family protein [Polyangiaceae bacterium]MCB9608874.1 DUF99 family protein [Polyangiaceae bacterium]